MQKSQKILFTLFVSFILVFTGCKKEESISPASTAERTGISADAIKIKKIILDKSLNPDNTDPSIIGGGDDDRDGDKSSKKVGKGIHDKGNGIIGGGDDDRDGDKGVKKTSTSSGK